MTKKSIHLLIISNVKKISTNYRIVTRLDLQISKYLYHLHNLIITFLFTTKWQVQSVILEYRSYDKLFSRKRNSSARFGTIFWSGRNLEREIVLAQAPGRRLSITFLRITSNVAKSGILSTYTRRPTKNESARPWFITENNFYRQPREAFLVRLSWRIKAVKVRHETPNTKDKIK